MKRYNVDYHTLGIVADEVVSKLVNPFGSFEKATYIIYRYNGDIFYSFTTTCHNTEESIKLMKEYYESIYSFYLPKSYKIWKRTNGVQEVVYQYVYYRSYE